MREADDARLSEIETFHLGEMLDRPLSVEEQSLLLAAMPSLKPRAKTMIELAEGAMFLFDSVPLAFEDKAKAAIDAAPPGLLASLLNTLEVLPNWTMDDLESALRDAAESKGLGLGKVAQPLRSAVTGRAISPGIFDVLFLLGREEALHRIKAALTA